VKEWLWLQDWVGVSVSSGVSDVRVDVDEGTDGVRLMDTVTMCDRVRQERVPEAVED